MSLPPDDSMLTNAASGLSSPVVSTVRPEIRTGSTLPNLNVARGEANLDYGKVILEWGYAIDKSKIGDFLRELKRLDSQLRLDYMPTVGVEYLGTSFVIASSDRNGGNFRTLWRLATFADIDGVLQPSFPSLRDFCEAIQEFSNPTLGRLDSISRELWVKPSA